MLSAHENVNTLLVHSNFCSCGNTNLHLYIDQAQSYVTNYGLSKVVTEAGRYTMCDWSDPLCIEGPDMCLCELFEEYIQLALNEMEKHQSCTDSIKKKVWDTDLKLQAEFQAHPVNVYSIAIAEDTLYSSSNDGTIQAWNIGSWTQKKTLLNNPNDEVLRLITSNKKLYSGDDKGRVRIWQNEEEIGMIETGEEVWDLAVVDKLLLTVRNLDVSVVEMVGGKSQYTFKASLLGRSPLCIAKDKLCFLSRCGRIINIHDFNLEKQFPEVAQIEAHELIINTLCYTDNPDMIIFSGGYDNTIKGWKLSDQSLIGSMKIDSVVNCLCSDKKGNVFVGSAYGYMAKLSTPLL